jgi:hypothetical protein
MHALGIFHEQSRSDRDRFVKVHWDNILPGRSIILLTFTSLIGSLTAYRGNFEKQSLTNTTYSFEYDYDSIMHYGKNYFSKNKGKPTMTTKMAGVKIGQRVALSKTDCLKINDLYQCLDKPRLRQKYYTICKILGI